MLIYISSLDKGYQYNPINRYTLRSYNASQVNSRSIYSFLE